MCPHGEKYDCLCVWCNRELADAYQAMHAGFDRMAEEIQRIVDATLAKRETDAD